MKKKILVGILLIVLFVLITSTAFASCISYNKGIWTSWNTSAMYAGLNWYLHNWNDQSRVDIYGTYYEATQKDWIINASGSRISNISYVGEDDGGSYLVQEAGSARLHIQNYDYYDTYQMLAMGEFTDY